MSVTDVRAIIEQVERLLADAGDLPEQAELAIEKLLNVVEALAADKKALADEVELLRKKLELKKKSKTTAKSDDQQDDQGTTKSLIRITPPKSDGNPRKNQRPTTAVHSKISPFTTPSSVRSIPPRCHPTPCV